MASEHQSAGHRSADDLVVGLTGARFGGAAGRRRRAAEPPAEDTGAAHHRREEQLRVGQTGARFSAVSRRWRRRKEEDASERMAQPAPAGPAADPWPVDAAEKAAGEIQRAGTIDWAEWDGAVTEPDGMVRPYSWTGGRTTSRHELPLEALISATGQPPAPTAPPEHSTIMKLCDIPRSVAEFAALLSIPLGVARVVLGDMAEAGTIVVHHTIGSADSMPGLDLMRRVLNGLQRL